MPKRFSSPLARQQGFTLIELAIVLSIVGVIIGGTWYYAAQTLNDIKKNKIIDQTLQIIQNTKRTFANVNTAPVSSTATNLTASAITAGIFPSDMIVNTTQAADPYGQPVVLSTSSAQISSFHLQYNVRTDVCIALLTKLIANTTTRNRYGIIGYNANGTFTPVSYNSVVPISTLASSCSSANGSNTLVTTAVDFSYK